MVAAGIQCEIIRHRSRCQSIHRQFLRPQFQKVLPTFYVSAPFSPSESLIAKLYKPSFPSTISILCGVARNWPTCTNIFRGHTDCVLAVVFSSGWHTSSFWAQGQLRFAFGMHRLAKLSQVPSKTTWTRSVLAFSPDGARVASGSWDKTIRIIAFGMRRLVRPLQVPSKDTE
jgi:WD40 repeat protein